MPYVPTAEAPSQPASPTRQRIIDAGYRLWLDEPPAVLFSGFTVSRLAKAAGVTRATFYSYWPGTEQYLEDLVGHLAESSTEDSYERAISSTVGDVGMARVGTVDRMLSACDDEFERLVADPSLRLRLGFLSKMDDPEVAALMRDVYRAAESVKVEAYGRLAEAWGREPRPPFTKESTYALYQVLGDVLAARHVIDPEMMGPEIYPLVILGLMMFVTRRVDDSRTMPQLVQHINSWPSVGARLREEEQAERAARSADLLDQAAALDVARIARRLQSTMAWHELTIAEIGSVSGISDDALLRTFGSKAGLAMAILDLGVGERFAALEPLGDPLAELRRALAVAGDELRRDPSLGQSALQIFTGAAALPPRELAGWSQIRVTLGAQIEAAQAAGQLRADLDPEALGGTLLRVLITDLAPTVTASSSPIDLLDLVLAGAAAHPDP